MVYHNNRCLYKNKLYIADQAYANISVSRGGTSYNGLYGEAPPERGTFFSLQVYKMVGISQFEVYKRVGKSVM